MVTHPVSRQPQGKRVLLLLSQLVPPLKCERYSLAACLIGPAKCIHKNRGKTSGTQACTNLHVLLDSINIVCIDPRDRGVTKCKAVVLAKKNPMVNHIGGSGRTLLEGRFTCPQ